MTALQPHSPFWTLTRKSATEAAHLFFAPLVAGVARVSSIVVSIRHAFSFALEQIVGAWQEAPALAAFVVVLTVVASIGLAVPFQLSLESVRWLDFPAHLDVPYGPIVRIFSLVAIIVGALLFAFGEGDSKRVLAGIAFGIGIAISAVNLLAWLF